MGRFIQENRCKQTSKLQNKPNEAVINHLNLSSAAAHFHCISVVTLLIQQVQTSWVLTHTSVYRSHTGEKSHHDALTKAHMYTHNDSQCATCLCLQLSLWVSTVLSSFSVCFHLLALTHEVITSSLTAQQLLSRVFMMIRLKVAGSHRRCFPLPLMSEYRL